MDNLYENTIRSVPDEARTAIEAAMNDESRFYVSRHRGADTEFNPSAQFECGGKRYEVVRVVAFVTEVE